MLGGEVAPTRAIDLGSARSLPLQLLPNSSPPRPHHPATPMTKPHPTTEPGYLNRNGQINIRPLGIPGTDHGQSLYQLACTHCGTNYAANGSDIHLRKCPACQGGNPSTAGWTLTPFV